MGNFGTKIIKIVWAVQKLLPFRWAKSGQFSVFFWKNVKKMTLFFDLNARIQQLTWSLIFYEKYSTSQSYLWFWPPLILGFSNFCRYYTRSQTGKSTAYRPTLKPLIHYYRRKHDNLIDSEINIFWSKNVILLNPKISGGQNHKYDWLVEYFS
jgi:hypothetical protein